MPLTFKDVTEILKLIDASQCEEVIVELEGTRLVVRRNASGKASATFTPASGEAVIVAADATERPANKANAQAARQDPAAPSEPGLTDVRAPMVGTFYSRPSPDEPIFVEVGDKVKAGDALCLIEVMKLYTTIEAPVDGTLVPVSPDDGGLVEYDQLLFQNRA